MQVERQYFFDAHTHPQFPAYDADRGEIVGRAIKTGVKMIAVGTQFSTSRVGIELAKKYPKDIWATAGFHPAHFSLHWYHDKKEQENSAREKFDIKTLEELGQNPKVVAIGECGLDYFRVNDETSKKQQREGFLAQLGVAEILKKPLMIHCRNAFGDLVDILKFEAKNLKSDAPGVVHFFTGTKDDAKNILALGFSFTFGGVVTFVRDYDEIIKMVPLERILSETDAPYVAPAPYRGKRNEPAYLVEVVKKLAELKNVSVDETIEQIYSNAAQIFGIK